MDSRLGRRRIAGRCRFRPRRGGGRADGALSPGGFSASTAISTGSLARSKSSKSIPASRAGNGPKSQGKSRPGTTPAAPGDDLGVSIFVTPGIYPSYAPGDCPDFRVNEKGTVPLEKAAAARPTVCVHTYPLPFHLWAEKYGDGQALAITPVEQVPPQCWPPELKCRSRMHYYLADKLAARQDPPARAVLLDRDGFVRRDFHGEYTRLSEKRGFDFAPGDEDFARHQPGRDV